MISHSFLAAHLPRGCRVWGHRFHLLGKGWQDGGSPIGKTTSPPYLVFLFPSQASLALPNCPLPCLCSQKPSGMPGPPWMMKLKRTAESSPELLESEALGLPRSWLLRATHTALPHLAPVGWGALSQGLWNSHRGSGFLRFWITWHQAPSSWNPSCASHMHAALAVPPDFVTTLLLPQNCISGLPAGVGSAVSCCSPQSSSFVTLPVGVGSFSILNLGSHHRAVCPVPREGLHLDHRGWTIETTKRKRTAHELRFYPFHSENAMVIWSELMARLSRRPFWIQRHEGKSVIDKHCKWCFCFLWSVSPPKSLFRHLFITKW